MPTTLTLAIGAPFVPTSIAGLAAWYDADAMPVVADGAALSQWDDESGNARHVTQATGANQPTYRTAVLNGKPVLRFDGSTDYMDVAFTALAQPNTIFLVAKSTGAVTNRQAFDSQRGGIDTARNTLYASGGGFWAMYGGGAEVVSSTSVDAAAVQITGLFNGGSSVLRRDGAQIASGNSGTQGCGGIRVGSYNGSSNFWSGDVAEILVYNAALSSTDRDSVEAYLRGKWNTP